MAVVSINEVKGDGARSFRWDLQSGRSYTRKFRVETDSRFDGPKVVGNALGAKLGDRYDTGYNAAEVDRGCFVNGISIDEDAEDGTSWLVTLSYGFLDINQVSNPDQNPLLNPVEVSWDMRDHDVALERDIDGRFVQNTAGDPFNPPVEGDDPRLLMTVVRNEAVYPIALVLTYRNAINSDQFAGFDPYFCKVLSINARNTWDQVCGWYYQVTYQFEFISPKVNDVTQGFRKQILSQGMRAISSITGKLYHVTYKGVPVNEPVLLNSSGWTKGASEDPFFVDVRAYPELPFSEFNFDPAAISGQRSGLDYAPAQQGS